MLWTHRRAPRQNVRSRPKWLRICGSVFLGLVALDVLILATHWPLTRGAVLQSLQKASSARVEIGRFRSVFFPYPGCFAEDVVIHHPDDPSGPPLLTISRMAVQADYSRLVIFSRNLTFVHTDGMHIRIRGGKQPGARRENNQMGSSLTIGALVADGTMLEFASEEQNKPPFLIAIHHVRLAPVSGNRAVNFETDLHIPTPPGEIHSGARFGPWNGRDPFAIPVSGSYHFHHADLAFAGGIAGILESQGAYHGPLRQIDVSDSAAVPDFRVTEADHPVALTAGFHATVNGETGDTVLHSVTAHFRHSDVTATGAVAAETAGGPKTVSLNMTVPRGRIDDFLYLLDPSARPGMKGDFSLRTRVVLPRASEGFLRNLQMNGAFQIAQARFTAPETEQTLDRVRDRSRHALVDYDSDAPSDLRGTAAVSEGVARLSNIAFESSGVSARLRGTFDLLTTRLDLGGTVHLATRLSTAATGVKSFLLKILNPFFKSRGRKGSDVPIQITGSHGHNSIGIDFGKKHDRAHEADRKATGR